MEKAFHLPTSLVPQTAVIFTITRMRYSELTLVIFLVSEAMGPVGFYSQNPLRPRVADGRDLRGLCLGFIVLFEIKYVVLITRGTSNKRYFKYM